MGLFDGWLAWAAGGLAVAAPLLAHLVGKLTVNRMRAVRANVADSIAGLVRRETGDGSGGDAARRFDRAVDQTFDKLATRFEPGVKGARARDLAAELDVPEEVVATALDQLTDAAPYAMSVTASGALLYDFEPGATGRLARRTLLRWPARIGWFLAALVANLGSVWPAVFIGVTCALTLPGIQHDFKTTIIVSVLAILAGLLAYWMAIGVGRFLSRPRTATPDPGPPHGQSDLEEAAREEDEFRDEIGVVNARTGVQGIWRVYKAITKGLFKGGGDKRAALVVLMIATLLALIALAIVSATSWLGGIWKILSGRLPRLDDRSPGDWVREPQPVGSAFLELGDELALTLLAAVRRLWDDTRPRDRTLAARVVALAARRGGRVSGLDLILREGFDEAEAITVAARVTGQLGGQVLVTEAGDVDCAFALPETEPYAAPPLESIELVRGEARAISEAIPVNVPGVTRYRLDSALNMATGALLAAVSWAALSSGGLLGGAIFGGLAAVTLATWGLVGAAHYGSRESARVGLLRDARRGALRILRERYRQTRSPYLPRSAFDSLVQTLDELDPSNGAETVWREVDMALSDAGVELAVSDDAPEELSYDLGPLRERFSSLEVLREEGVELDEVVELDDEVVVFETAG